LEARQRECRDGAEGSRPPAQGIHRAHRSEEAGGEGPSHSYRQEPYVHLRGEREPAGRGGARRQGHHRSVLPRLHGRGSGRSGRGPDPGPARAAEARRQDRQGQRRIEVVISVLIDTMLRSLALGIAVGLALCVLRVRNPHLQKSAWTAVLVAALVMPLLMRAHGAVIRAPGVLTLTPDAVSAAASGSVRPGLVAIYCAVTLL